MPHGQGHPLHAFVGLCISAVASILTITLEHASEISKLGGGLIAAGAGAYSIYHTHLSVKVKKREMQLLNKKLKDENIKD